MPPLSLDCLTLTDTSPEELIRSAQAAGFNLVSLWVHPAPIYPRQRLTASALSVCAALLADTGMGVHAIEAVDVTSAQEVLSARSALDLGAALGARAVVAFHHANPSRAEAAEALALLAEQAAQRGMRVVFEPVAMGQTRTLTDAYALISESGADVSILFDTWHFTRAGGSAADIAAIDSSLITRVQINDGLLNVPESRWLAEAVGERLYPGEGQFPLQQLLKALPDQVPWSIESPSLRRMQAGMSPLSQAMEAFEALQSILRSLAC